MTPRILEVPHLTFNETEEFYIYYTEIFLDWLREIGEIAHYAQDPVTAIFTSG